MSPVKSQNENLQANTPEVTAPSHRFDSKWLLGAVAVVALVIGWILLPKRDNPQKADELIAVSLQQAQAGRYQDCIDTARQALQAKPDSATAYNNIGWCSAKLGNWDEALRHVREAQRLDPNLEVAKNNLAWILAQNTKSDPKPSDAALSASNQHALAGRYVECIDSARQALKLYPKEPLAYNNIGWCSAKLGKWSDAYDNLREALRIQPNLQIAENNRRWVVEEMAKRGSAAAR